MARAQTTSLKTARSLFILSAAFALSLMTVEAAILPPGFTETFQGGVPTGTAMALAPDGRIFLCDQVGELRVIQNGALLPTPFVRLTVDSNGERGLLGVAIDPNFASNGYVYVYYTATTPVPHNRVSRFTAQGNVAAPGSEMVLLELDDLDAAINHNGGALNFGADGRLYVAVGDNATGANSQSLGTVKGKMLRINSDGTIPSDNPFYGSATGNNRAIWALGLRNPFTFAVHRVTGRIHINDVGDESWEEVNLGAAGANYGWPSCEGNCGNPAFTNPVYTYPRSGGDCAITGAAFYDPSAAQFPAEYADDYFFGDFCSGEIRRRDAATGQVTTFATDAAFFLGLMTGPDGSLYYLNTNGVFRIQYAVNQPPQITQHPAPQTAAVGGTAAFSVAATGASPLSFQWQRNGTDIPGATAASYTTPPAVPGDDGALFRCVVTNGLGNATSNAAALTVAGQNPTGSILTPASGLLYSGGDTLSFSGSAADPEDGPLPASAFTWRVDFHHNTHVHPAMPSTTGITSGSISVPTQGEPSDNVWFRIHLRVTDLDGLFHDSYRDVLPRTAAMTFATSPAGLGLTLDGAPRTAPFLETGVTGIERSIGAPSPQLLNSVSYVFDSWSDGGAAVHTISTPAAATAYTAVFRPADQLPPAAPRGLLIQQVQ